MNQRIEECEAVVRAFRQSGRRSASQETELRLLEASLERARGDVAAAERTLDQLEATRTPGAPEPFQLPMQRGLNAYQRCDYTKALDRFLAASRLARGKTERAYALSNVLLCLECLGLSSHEVHDELKGLAVELEAQRALPGLGATLRCYELRTAFRAGRFAAVAEAPADREAMTQEQYYQLWVAELPFHAASRGAERLRERFYLASPSFHLKAYRLRTIQMQLHPDDLRDFKVTELCDRLYLWVWKWLSDPERHPVDRIVALLAPVDLREIAPRLSAEDFQLLRNALLWLSLFDPAAFAPVSKIIQSLQIPHVRDFPLFELERLALEYLAAAKRRRREGPELKALKAHPLWESREYGLAALLKELLRGRAGTGRLARLGQSLRGLLGDSEPARKAGLGVDLATWVIRPAGGGKRVISEPMCLGFDLLRRQGSADFAEFLRATFGLGRYEPEIHDAKIFNLLSRMRQVAPAELVLSTRQRRVYATGSWAGVAFSESAEARSRAQLARLGWDTLMKSKSQTAPAPGRDARLVEPMTALKRLAGSQEMSRADLEKLTGKSRSTAGRIIARWIAEGRVVRVGSAKRSRYVFNPSRERS